MFSPQARRAKGFEIRGFGDDRELPEEIHEQLVENARAPIPDQAAFRIDLPAWLSTLGKRCRRVAVLLMEGYTTNAVARMVGVTPGRISQIRRELEAEWACFHEVRSTPDLSPARAAA